MYIEWSGDRMEICGWEKQKELERIKDKYMK